MLEWQTGSIAQAEFALRVGKKAEGADEEHFSARAGTRCSALVDSDPWAWLTWSHFHAAGTPWRSKHRSGEQQPANMADLMAEARGTTCLKPYEISAELRPKIDALALWDNVAELRDHGYTVVHDVAPPEMFDELREAIHRLAQESEGDLKGLAASMLLGRHPVVDAVATLPKILAVAAASVGQGMRASQFVASIKREGGAGLDVHADQNWLPAPFPAHNCVITFACRAKA